MDDILNEIRPRTGHLPDSRLDRMLHEIMHAPPVRRRRLTVRALALAGACVVIVGAGAVAIGNQFIWGDESGTASCIPRVRIAGTVFVLSAWTEGVTTKPLGLGERGVCGDVAGDGSPSVTFPENAETVELRSIPGFDPTRVVAWQQRDGSYLVFVVSTAPADYVDEVREKVASSAATP